MLRLDGQPRIRLENRELQEYFHPAARAFLAAANETSASPDRVAKSGSDDTWSVNVIACLSVGRLSYLVRRNGARLGVGACSDRYCLE